MLADDEGWQYGCSVCHGDGNLHPNNEQSPKIMSVDENNRLLD
ncbi:hypothetical protein [Bacillus niameyensis]|nr:hypothetical protein [Bacillus niameyensis]